MVLMKNIRIRLTKSKIKENEMVISSKLESIQYLQKTIKIFVRRRNKFKEPEQKNKWQASINNANRKIKNLKKEINTLRKDNNKRKNKIKKLRK